MLPVLRDSIEPVLRKIRRELTLVVNYRPGEPITLRISREPNLADLDNAAILIPDDIPDFHKRNKQRRAGKRKPNKGLKVTLADGTVFEGINIVSTSKDPNRQQRQMGNFYVFTNTSTQQKAKTLKDIAERLNVSMKIEVTN